MVLPVGEIVDDCENAELPARKVYEGKYVTLSPVNPNNDVDDLFAASHGDEENLAIWTYIPISGPFQNKESMFQWLQWCQNHPDYIFLTVRDKSTNRCVGMTAFVSIVPDMRIIEVGFIWYTPAVQNTKVNTESIYLMLCELFDRLTYRRVEWKCDSLNAKSRSAALRLGFSFEGVFRKHRIVNKRNRDTAWYAMTEDEWPDVKKNMQRWLYSDEVGLSLRELNSTIVAKYAKY